ncbi:hypothetical protein AVW15_17020 [Chelatococcus daeguensis]|uniref:Anti-sigma factor NepR domain-containing protein n=1 Tax=Chelatococcus daeguensis TaxID=444444 RepID=A0AAC9P0W9_9HYPH|nr:MULTISPECIES: NepR family anti-sigma factor [Chelatococcus]APF39141.1 hypothetical protein BOQ54_14790 [Chelatococcus daeguensis]KZE34572.1 hypothetical protein AVW15_17020 [Chelatococcus daeguensis]
MGGRAPRSRPALDKDVQVQIGQQLRAVYDDVLRQEVPDRFMKLLAELDARTGAPLPRADEPDEGEEKQ